MYGKSYSQTAQDVHFSVGETGIRLLFGCVLALGLLGYGAYIIDGQEVAKSAYWPTTQGQLLSIESKHIGMPIIGRFLPVSCPHAKYSYSIDNHTYEKEVTAGPCITFVRAVTFKAPEMIEGNTKELIERMDKARAESLATGKTPANFAERWKADMDLAMQVRYKPITVRYERAKPENSVLDPAVLQSDKSQLYSSMLLIAIGGFLLGGSYFTSHVNKLSQDDPSLSVETALAAQKRRRS
jgi:hypothetical protein